MPSSSFYISIGRHSEGIDASICIMKFLNLWRIIVMIGGSLQTCDTRLSGVNQPSPLTPCQPRSLNCGMEWSIKRGVYWRLPWPTFLCFLPYHVRLGHNVSFERPWSACSEPCSPLFYWFLDFTTHWCPCSKIHQNVALQVSFLSCNDLILTWHYVEMVPRSLAHPGPYSRPCYPRWMVFGSSNIYVTAGRTLPGSSSENWANPSNSLRSTIDYWRIRSFL